MTCFPPCSSWCVCVGNECQPSPVMVNAVRFRTPDGRYLQALGGGGLVMVAAAVAPQASETFLFVPPTTWPLRSADAVSFDVFNATWDPSGFLVRVYHTVVILHGSGKDPDRVTYEIGGAETNVYVREPFSAGYPAYNGDDPAEWTFDILRLEGGAVAAAGTPINSGDQVVLRINSNLGNTFYFRVSGDQDGAGVLGDGTVPGADGTVLVAEFSEVRSGLGWRPPEVVCQVCARVTVHVTRAGTAPPRDIGGASVMAQVPDHPFFGTTGPDGRTLLNDGDPAHNCVPPGATRLVVAADRHQTKSVSVPVPEGGEVDVEVQLDCTPIRGRVVDTSGNAVPGVTVYLRDQSAPPLVVLDENGNPYRTTTAADGSFSFGCVPHRWIQVWTTADPSQTQNAMVIPPEGWTNVVIVIQTTCGNLVGTVTDADTGAPIQGASVTTSGGQQATTAADGSFSILCVKPSGSYQVFASAPGYAEDFANGEVPDTGDSAPVNIQLHRVAVVSFQIRLDWGMQPGDLDSHLSWPDAAAGRLQLYYGNRVAPPAPFVNLDLDDTTSFGPETVTIFREPRGPAGSFVPGLYRYWVHDFSAKFNPNSTFVGSGASVALSSVDAQGVLTSIQLFAVTGAQGDQAPIWRVFELTIEANGRFMLQANQTFQNGDETDVL